MRALLVATLLSALTLAAPASAQTSDAAIATELFSAGLLLMKENNFAAACPKLADSARLDPKVGTLARLGECEEKLTRLASARGRWQQALNLARVQRDERVPLVEAELARLDAIVPKLTLTLAGALPHGLGVRLDEVDVGAGSLGVPLPIDPGRHTVLVTAPGKLPWSGAVEAKANGAVVQVAIPVLEDEEPAALGAIIASSAPSHARGGLRSLGLASAGAGLAGLGVGTAFGVVALTKRNDSNKPGGCSGPSGNDCPGVSYDTRNAARDAGTASTGFFIAGGVLLAAGVTVWLLTPKNEGRPSASIRAVPGVAPGFASMSVLGAW